VDVFVPEHTWLQWPLSLLLLLGVALSLRKPHRAFLLFTGVLLHRALITLAFFGYARGMLVIFPALLPLLLLPLKAWADSRPPLASRLPGLASCALLLLWLQAGVLALQGPRNFMASGSTDRLSGKLIQDDEVRLWPKR
jgi:hypothetical protein